MSQNDQTEAVLAAAFGQDAVGTPAPATPAAPATDEINLWVDAPAAPAAPTLTPDTPAAAPAAPVDNSIEDLRARLAQAEAQAAYHRGLAEARATQPQTAAPAAPEAPVYDPAQDALTAEEMVAYKDSLPVIEKLARQASMRVQAQAAAQFQALQQENQTMRQQLEQVTGLAQRSDEVALMHTVRNAVPDLETVTRSKEWKNYLNNRAPFAGGRKVAEVLEHAIRSRDAETITEHVLAFKASHNISAPPAMAPAPGRTAAPAAVGLDVPQQRRGISASALDEAMARAQAGTLSKEAYDKMLAQAFGAAASGSELVQ